MPYPASEVEVRPIEGKIKGSTSKGSSGNARGSPEKSEDGRKGTSASADNASRRCALYFDLAALLVCSFWNCFSC